AFPPPEADQFEALTDDLVVKGELFTPKHPDVYGYDYQSATRSPIINVSLNDEQTSSSGSPESSLHLPPQARPRTKSFRLPSFGKPKAPDSPDSQRDKDGKHRERKDSGGSTSTSLRQRVVSLLHKNSDDSLKDKAKERPLSFIGGALPKPRADGGLVPSLEVSPSMTKRASKLLKPRDSISSVTSAK
ncbi:hypothetical protein M407DRAFT_35112, partial [Tulasnella calospora MUT 4182]